MTAKLSAEELDAIPKLAETSHDDDCMNGCVRPCDCWSKRSEALLRLTAQVREGEALETEVRAVLASLPQRFVVRVREGSGPENVAASLAVSVANLVNRLAKLLEFSRDKNSPIVAGEATRTAAMLRQGADAESRWEQLKAEVGKTAADYAADIEINTYRSGQKAHAKAVLAEMARLEKERTA